MLWRTDLSLAGTSGEHIPLYLIDVTPKRPAPQASLDAASLLLGDKHVGSGTALGRATWVLLLAPFITELCAQDSAHCAWTSTT